MSVDGAMRVSDAERGRVADRLARAHGEGRLTLAEYDERVRAAHAAVVRADLAPLTTDLPDPDPVDRPDPVDLQDPVGLPQGPVGRRHHCVAGAFAPFPLPSGGLRGAVAAWAVVSALNVLIWLAVVLGSGAFVYPWWVWVAGPWGAVLLLGALGRSGQRRRSSRPERTAPSRM